jgi:glycerophosphoryl diester phosphodiesterase
LAWYGWVLAVIAALCALYLWLIAPGRNRPDAGALTGRLYAHRGLHDSNQSIPENSHAAFRRAVEAGYGIELDVQLTVDNRLVVHHDGNTLRVCGVDAEIRQTPYAVLPALPDGSAVPTFAEVLELVAGRAPLIVEVKPYGSAAENAAATLAALREYKGPYCVESFHPSVVRYFRRHAPGVIRGQLSTGGKRNPEELGFLSFFMLKNLLVNVFSRPHFISYSAAEDRALSMTLMKRLYHPLLVAWTIRGQAALDKARKTYDMVIFELFTPDAKK